MSIRADADELQAIDAELKLLSQRRKALLQQKAKVEARMAEYLKAKGQPGVKYNGVAILLEEKTVHTNKKPQLRDEEARAVLERYGVPNPDQALKEIMEARKGPVQTKTKMKLKKIPT